MKKDEKISTQEDNIILRDEVVESRKGLQQTLLDLTEQKVLDPFSDESIDRENLKIQLISGEVIDLKRLEVVCHELQEWTLRFPNEYYLEIFRLNGWRIPKNQTISEKPNIVGKWTKEIIYNRFPRQVLPTLEHLNPYVRIGLRKFKHHQYLNDEGLQRLDHYINEAILVMKDSAEWYEFRVNLHKKHEVPYQLDIYEEKKRAVAEVDLR